MDYTITSKPNSKTTFKQNASNPLNKTNSSRRKPKIYRSHTELETPEKKGDYLGNPPIKAPTKLPLLNQRAPIFHSLNLDLGLEAGIKPCAFL